MESLDKLFVKLEQVLNRETKVRAVQEVIQRLVREGWVLERPISVEFSEGEARAWAEINSEDFVPHVRARMQSLERYLNADVILVVEAPEAPMRGDEKTDGWKILRSKLERLGFVVSTWREEGMEHIEARYRVLEHGGAVTYLKVRDSYYLDC